MRGFGMGTPQVLEQAITSAAHCRFGKADPGYIARIWGGGDGMRAPQVAQAPIHD